ncbi:MipA/OmpV family protein [Consotaella salsifontis]|uniref:Outer membrane protein n=1 Tax=Consotaella salsifontis TaxID=1365950 RepID=A0A1T4TFB2_9HYPH|nr:MipA/OmpV family protein [Consotaella salsifontis]SKA39126.1 outer membrane protein [Consotaella salsifontis]
MITRTTISACVLTLLLASAAHAADIEETTAVSDYGDSDLVIDLGVAGVASPEYMGSDSYSITPLPTVSVEYLNIPGIGSFGGKDGLGFSIGPSFGYTGKRDASDHRALNGLDDVDATYEAGIKLGYEWNAAEVYGAARYAFGGAEGFVGEVGANAILRPTPTLELKAGPIARFASADYVDSYFGVSAAESAASGGRLSAYDAGGGFTSAGVAASARYEVVSDWFVNADASYEKIVGDAADSPIVAAGDENQFSFKLGVSHRFRLDLF